MSRRFRWHPLVLFLILTYLLSFQLSLPFHSFFSLHYLWATCRSYLSSICINTYVLYRHYILLVIVDFIYRPMYILHLFIFLQNQTHAYVITCRPTYISLFSNLSRSQTYIHIGLHSILLTLCSVHKPHNNLGNNFTHIITIFCHWLSICRPTLLNVA